jgi:hypothetical protein
MPKASELLRAARALWNKFAWSSKRPVEIDADGNIIAMCAGTVMAVAVSETGNNPRAWWHLTAEMGGFAPDFNNTPGRTAEEVFTAFDQAALNAEAEERAAA